MSISEELTARRPPAASLDEVIEVLRFSATFDMTLDPRAHHDLLDHGLQCGAVLLTERPDDVELQVAGVLHDIGHMIPPYDDRVHGQVAADFLRPVMGDRVADLVRLHVPAKRYLATTETTYRDTLNWGSTVSLENQGGDMTVDETSGFEHEALFMDAVTLRRADEAAKVAGLVVPGIEAWVDALRAVAQG
jgi:predicted HD phosphohydrolase